MEDLWLPTLTNIGGIAAGQLEFGDEHTVEDLPGSSARFSRSS